MIHMNFYIQIYSCSTLVHAIIETIQHICIYLYLYPVVSFKLNKKLTLINEAYDI